MAIAAPLVPIQVPSIYKSRDGNTVLLPSRMARGTPDMKATIDKVGKALGGLGGRLVLSDLFRSYDMQLQAHLDYTSGKKAAFSPPPGGSLHEAGRALDLDLRALSMPLADFWPVAASCGLVPIIDKPDPSAKEAWHFECRGSHQLVSDHYRAGRATNFSSPYKAMAASAILAVGVPVDALRQVAREAFLQSGLIRLGQDVGNIDGKIGPKTRKALASLQLAGGALGDLVAGVDSLLQEKFPEEYFDRSAIDEPIALGSSHALDDPGSESIIS